MTGIKKAEKEYTELVRKRLKEEGGVGKVEEDIGKLVRLTDELVAKSSAKA